jgi:hypothetical protein
MLYTHSHLRLGHRMQQVLAASDRITPLLQIPTSKWFTSWARYGRLARCLTSTIARLQKTGNTRLRQSLMTLRFHALKCLGICSNAFWKWHLASFERKLAERQWKNTRQVRAVYQLVDAIKRARTKSGLFLFCNISLYRSAVIKESFQAKFGEKSALKGAICSLGNKLA